MDKKIQVEDILYSAAPRYVMVYMEADVSNTSTPCNLKDELAHIEREICEKTQLADINKIPPIFATRQVYKKFKKDPNRYRPSQEQLMRRIVRGLGLYHIDALVDTGNMISLRSGCSIGVFDRDKIQGEVLTVGVGRAGEPYEGIGRGPLNIEGIPVVRDAAGGIGTPTSDNERTKVSASTSRISVCFHAFDEDTVDIDNLISMLCDGFTRHCDAVHIETAIIKCNI